MANSMSMYFWTEVLGIGLMQYIFGAKRTKNQVEDSFEFD